MTARGVHFAIDDDTAAQLLAARDDDAVMEVIEQIEEEGDFDACATDKAWDAIHRSLTDGELTYVGGNYPLRAAILGGRQLYREDDYLVSYLTPAQAADVAAALGEVDEALLHKGYSQIEPEDYEGSLGTEDFGYTWQNFVDLRAFFQRAAAAAAHVIFTVDQ